MFFTEEDYKKIEQYLINCGVKDSCLEGAVLPFQGNEKITIVQDGKNRTLYFRELIEALKHSKAALSDLYNVTDHAKEKYITLKKAIELVPYKARKLGQIITFLNPDSKWELYQFTGASILQWNELSLWNDLFNLDEYIVKSILPDEEDLTKSEPNRNGNSYLSLKDREYNPAEFSGLGRVILRKNIMEVESEEYGKVKKNVLLQDMINKPNTIYEIRYDFDLNSATINIPENCTLDFQGGSFKNGTLKKLFEIKSSNNNIIFNNVIIKGTIKNKAIEATWFGEINDKVDSSVAINKAIQAANACNIIYLPDCSITVSTPILINKGVNIDGRNYCPRYNIKNIIIPTNINMSVFIIGTNHIAGKLSNISIGAYGHNEMIRKFTGISVTGCESFIFENIKIIEADIAYDLNTSTSIGLPIFDKIEAQQCNKGMYIRKSGDGWANGIMVKPTWFSNNYIHFHITTGAVTTIQGGNVEVGNTNVTYPWFGSESRAFLIEGKDTSVNIIGCIWGENIKPYYAEVKDFALLNIVGESWILGRIKVGTYGKVYKTGSMINVPNFISKEFKIVKPYYYLSAKNVHKKGYFYKFIDIYNNGALPDANIRISKINGIPYFNRFNLEKTIPESKILKSFTLGIKLIFKIPQFEFTFLFGGNWGKPYLILNCNDKNFFINYHVKDGSEDNRNLLIPPQTYNKNNEYVIFNCLISFNNEKNEAIITSSDGVFKVNTNLNLSTLEFNTQNFLLNESNDEEQKKCFVSDIILFDKVLNGEESLYWINYLNNGGEDYTKIGNETPDSAPLGYYFYNTKDNTIQYKVEEDLNEGTNIIKWSSVSANINNTKKGTTAQRPTGVQIGFTYKDTDLNRWITWNGTSWEDSNGLKLTIKSSGTFAQKPTTTDNIPVGFKYFCTDKQTTEGTTNGIMIYHKGNNVWVDALGRVVN